LCFSLRWNLSIYSRTLHLAPFSRMYAAACTIASGIYSSARANSSRSWSSAGLSSFFLRRIVASTLVIGLTAITSRASTIFTATPLVRVVTRIVPFALCGRYDYRKVRLGVASGDFETIEISSKLSSTSNHIPWDSSCSHLITNSKIFTFASSRPGTFIRSAISRYPCSIRSTLLAYIQNTHKWLDRSRRRWQYSMASWDLLMLCQ
jgi:hypothetical protein